MASEVNVGDKFVLKISAVYWSPHLGNRYFIEGWDNSVLTDDDISALEKYKEPPKEVPHTCDNCVHKYRPFEESPCAMCDKNEFERRDMFEAMK